MHPFPILLAHGSELDLCLVNISAFSLVLFLTYHWVFVSASKEIFWINPCTALFECICRMCKKLCSLHRMIIGCPRSKYPKSTRKKERTGTGKIICVLKANTVNQVQVVSKANGRVCWDCHFLWLQAKDEGATSAPETLHGSCSFLESLRLNRYQRYV